MLHLVGCVRERQGVEVVLDLWVEVVSFFDAVPAGVWVGAMAANLVLTAATWSVARRRVRRAGERAAKPQVVTGATAAKDTALTIAALVPAGLFLVMVVAGSMHGLIAFGRNVLEWHDGWEYLVPATLDGVSVAFAFLAFRAVRRGGVPDRCYRVVWGAASRSAADSWITPTGLRSPGSQHAMVPEALAP